MNIQIQVLKNGKETPTKIVSCYIKNNIASLTKIIKITYILFFISIYGT